MRPRNQAARDQLATVLGRQAAQPAAALAARLGVSVPTLHRLLREQAPHIVATGRAQRARYAWRRPLRGDAAALPLFEVDAAGTAREVAALALVQPEGAHLSLEASNWPVPEAARDGWWPGLPYVLADMRPQGYLGRQLARGQHRALGVSPDPQAWGDDDTAHVLNHAGEDCSGSLVLGQPAFERWQQRKLAPPEPLAPAAVGAGYARLAEQAVAAGVPGSSAAGEFPKFPALRRLADAEAQGPDAGVRTPHVLVKFSGAEPSAAVRRWSDLLVCEHLALKVLRGAADTGPGAARSRIVQHAGRSFLEVERFDRHGLFGRSPLVSLATVDACFVGLGNADWPKLAERLRALKLVTAAGAEAITALWWFGRLIANSDMHAGNLSFRPVRDPATGRALLEPAPAYDMLPMAYAPLPGGEVPPRSHTPALPLPAQREAWLAAAAAALAFWAAAARDSRISPPFRAVCAENGGVLREVAERL